MSNILLFLAIFGLAFFIKESDGPFDLMAGIRRKLLQNKIIGVFFYKLLSCYFCVGCHCGWIVYLLATPFVSWSVDMFIVWTLAGGSICLLINKWLER